MWRKCLYFTQSCNFCLVLGIWEPSSSCGKTVGWSDSSIHSYIWWCSCPSSPTQSCCCWTSFNHSTPIWSCSCFVSCSSNTWSGVATCGMPGSWAREVSWPRNYMCQLLFSCVSTDSLIVQSKFLVQFQKRKCYLSCLCMWLCACVAVCVCFQTTGRYPNATCDISIVDLYFML